MSKQTIGEFLAIQRKARGLTQQEVADMLGISNKTLSSWESGRSYPDILTLPALAEIYGVTVDEIVNGERTVRGEDAGEISERSQKKLLKNAANRYSVKCTTLAGIGIGGMGLFVLAFCLGFVATWLFILFAVLSVLTEVTVVILFVVFEKSASLIEEERSRYSLMIKRLTYKAAFKIVCALCVLIVCAIFAIRWMTGNVTLASVWTVTMLLIALLSIALLSIVFLVWLSRRGKEFYTAEESAASARNIKLTFKLFSIGGAISVVLILVTSVLSSISFTHIEKSIDLPKDDFIRLVQTIEVSADDAMDYGIKTDGEGAIGDYFVDIKATLSKPIETSLFEKHGYAYHIEGNLYFRYSIDYDANNRCYISYISDTTKAFEITLCYGTVWFRNQGQFRSTYPNPTAEDLLLGIENEEVFFVLNPHLSSGVSSTTDGFGGYHYCSERYVDRSDDRYALVLKVAQNYPFIAMIGFGGVLITAIVCICFYYKKHTAIL